MTWFNKMEAGMGEHIWSYSKRILPKPFLFLTLNISAVHYLVLFKIIYY